MWRVASLRLLVVFGAAMPGAAIAAPEPPQSPACALLSEDEAIRAVRGAPTLSDGGAADEGYSDCAWSTAGGSVLSLIFWQGDHFTVEGKTAEEHYAGLAAAMKRRNLPFDPVSGIGDRALLLDEGSPGLIAYTLIVLKTGSVVQLSGRGLGRSETLEAARAIAGRMDAAAIAVASDMASPACALLREADLPVAGFTVNDGGPMQNGESACNWQQAEQNIDISIVLRERGSTPYTLPDPETGDAAEIVAGIGEGAFLESAGEGENASYALTLVEDGNLAVLNTFRVDRASVLKLGGAMAGRMGRP